MIVKITGSLPADFSCDYSHLSTNVTRLSANEGQRSVRGRGMEHHGDFIDVVPERLRQLARLGDEVFNSLSQHVRTLSDSYLPAESFRLSEGQEFTATVNGFLAAYQEAAALDAAEMDEFNGAVASAAGEYESEDIRQEASYPEISFYVA